MRAITSVPPPGGYGTMKVIGFVGQANAEPIQNETMRNSRRRMKPILTHVPKMRHKLRHESSQEVLELHQG
jgi:hypothetical protein